MGYRYRLHRKDLPGKPDIVFGPRQKVIFVHGCFWHGHSCKRGSRLPKTNAEYWQAKIARNVERHSDQLDELTAAGWDGTYAMGVRTRRRGCGRTAPKRFPRRDR